MKNSESKFVYLLPRILGLFCTSKENILKLLFNLSEFGKKVLLTLSKHLNFKWLEQGLILTLLTGHPPLKPLCYQGWIQGECASEVVPIRFCKKLLLLEAVVRMCPIKKVFLEILQNSEESICARGLGLQLY